MNIANHHLIKLKICKDMVIDDFSDQFFDFFLIAYSQRLSIDLNIAIRRSTILHFPSVLGGSF